MKTPGKIDVHHHAIPSAYREVIASSGRPQIQGVDPVKWDVETDLVVMDRNGIDLAILSVTAPGTTFVEGDAAIQLARRVNAELAETVARHPSRFGAFAVLPLPNVDAAITEIDYAIDQLGMMGIGLFSNFSGVYLGDEKLEPVFQHLADRDLIAFIHPTLPSSQGQATFGIPPSICEFPFDTTRAIANLLYSGTLDRHPSLKLIVAHAGGAIPYLAKRLAYAPANARALLGKPPKDLMGSLRRLYYDTAMSANQHTLAALTSLVGIEQILFGSDYPYLPEFGTKETVEGVTEFFNESDLEAVSYRNQKKLFSLP